MSAPAAAPKKEVDCLSPEAQKLAEARLAAKRAARAEAREIRMKELERQQKEIYQVQKKYYGLDTKWGDIEQWMEDSERCSRRARRTASVSDEDEHMSVGSRGSLWTNGYDGDLCSSQPLSRRSGRVSTGSGHSLNHGWLLGVPASVSPWRGVGGQGPCPPHVSCLGDSAWRTPYYFACCPAPGHWIGAPHPSGSCPYSLPCTCPRIVDHSTYERSWPISLIHEADHCCRGHSVIQRTGLLLDTEKVELSGQHSRPPKLLSLWPARQLFGKELGMVASSGLAARGHGWHGQQLVCALGDEKGTPPDALFWSQASVLDESSLARVRRGSGCGSYAPSEHSGHLTSSSRASSRASSARASPVVEEKPEKDCTEKGSRNMPGLSAATLASLGGTSSRRGSGDTSISLDTEPSIREIKELNELKDQIQDVEGRYIQGLKEMKDSLAEVEEKYKKAMVSNAQLDNEKTNFMYQVDTLKDVLLELEEQLAESRRQYEEKNKELEREKHAHSILQFQFAEVKEALRQREEMLEEIRQLQQKQASYVREISDLQETIEWKDKKIGALERQKEFFDSIRSERDDLRQEAVALKEELKKHGIIINSETATNGETPDLPNNTGHQGPAKVTTEQLSALRSPGDGPPDTRLKKLMDEREGLLEQIKKLQGQLEGKQKNGKLLDTLRPEGDILENGMDLHVADLQRDANRQISDLKFKLAKSEQEITTLEQNVIRLESQVSRYKSAAENAEKIEDELKAEKRKLQRELRSALDKTEELEVSNGHLVKRLEKMKANRSALLSQQ
ncbi:leucine-rich repeat flightless-interacting protein 1 [Ochotona curzoniae]|uniref:leucine-rich repeat flightless-interacting protein 1 n=1 Tax=Ochotona curzoniae TaxID=130825 RepID=UPI001B3509E9|nr:leucine-rich repeat flightless-interacting protein 1 [Ochotona curzoniae]